MADGSQAISNAPGVAYEIVRNIPNRGSGKVAVLENLRLSTQLPSLLPTVYEYEGTRLPWAVKLGS
jgi:hypothetical protein